MSDEQPQLISFIGYPTGDMECACWAVDRATFIRLTGQKPTTHDRIWQERRMYRVYLDGLIREKFGYKDDEQLAVALTVMKAKPKTPVRRQR